MFHFIIFTFYFIIIYKSTDRLKIQAYYELQRLIRILHHTHTYVLIQLLLDKYNIFDIHKEKSIILKSNPINVTAEPKDIVNTEKVHRGKELMEMERKERMCERWREST